MVHKIAIVVPADNHAVGNRFNRSLAEILDRIGAHYEFVIPQPGSALQQQKDIINALEQSCADTVFLYKGAREFGLVAVAAKLSRRHLVVYLSGSTPGQRRDDSWRVRIAANASYQVATRLADLLLTEFRSESFEAHAGVSGRRNIREFHTYYVEPGQVQRGPEDRTDIVLAGRLSAEKGVGDLAECARDVIAGLPPQARLVIAGDGPLRNQLQKAMPEATFLGWISEDHLQTAFSNARFVLAPSRTEAFGLAVLQGMSNGAVPIVRNVGGLATVAAEGRGFIFNSLRDLPSVLKGAWDHPSLTDRSRASRDWVLTSFGLERAVHANIECISSWP